MHVSEQSRANDSSNWRRRDDGAAPPPASTSSWSRPRKDNRPNDANGRSTAAYPARTHHVEKNGEDIDYSKRIYLGNLLYSATEDDVKSLLEGFDYSKVVISIDPMTGRNPSYCFVDFNTEEEAQRGLAELDGKMLLERPVKTRPATKPGEGSKKYEPTRARPPQANWKEPPQDRQQSWAFNRWQKDPAEAREHNVPSEGCRVWLGSLPSFNLNPPLVQTNVKALFEDKGFTPTAISKIVPPAPEHKQPDGRDHYCFVDFATKEESAKAVEALNNATPPWGGRPVKVRVSGTRSNSSWKVHQRKDYMKQQGLQSATDEGTDPAVGNPSEESAEPLVQREG